MKVFTIDKSRCVGCRGCQIACKDEHVGNPWLPYSEPQPRTGHFWMRVEAKEHGQIPKVRVEHTPIMCQHCASCALAAAAPGAVVRRRDGLVLLDPKGSHGRSDLASLCPHGAVFWNEELGLPQKCTGCAHLVDAGEVPHCVDVCATGALRFGDEEEFREEIEAAARQGNARALGGPLGSTRVVYLNDPGLFIGGCVFDPEDDEAVTGARVSLAAGSGEILEKTETDGFGDFWFEHLGAGSYSVRIEAEGFRDEKRDGIELSESLNLGDIAMVR